MLTGMVERGLLPDPLVRFGVRRLLRDRLRQEERGGGGDALLERMRSFRLSSTHPEPKAEPSFILRSLPELWVEFEKA